MSKCIRPQCNFSYLAGASITFCFISQQLLKLNWFLMISILTIRMALSQAVGILGVTQLNSSSILRKLACGLGNRNSKQCRCQVTCIFNK
ncbi:uncharacterized protein LOC128259048 isoform X4 [Drosophila gunungcola]|uniref:uncharacterized protein LOC128259048 isoform X4 n=1 Tax=Drosophila gunungcola TaxID=103775 RepID=UPI0022E0F3D0|nr:uncharacterized protein LOC128259048 isoform X4 [Drosophila gunungcola]